MFIDTLFARARSVPHKAALIRNGVACSYAGSARRIAEAHSLLRAQGLPVGSRAVLFMNSLAAAWVGMVRMRVDYPRTGYLDDPQATAERMGKVMRGELQETLLRGGGTTGT